MFNKLVQFFNEYLQFHDLNMPLQFYDSIVYLSLV